MTTSHTTVLKETRGYIRLTESYARLIVMAAIILSLVIPCFGSDAESSQSQTLQTDTPGESVLFYVSVQDAQGKYVNNLAKESFIISDGSTPLDITFYSTESLPLSVGIVIDKSGSMAESRMRLVPPLKDALRRFVESGHTLNQHFVQSFDKQPHTLVEWTKDSSAVASSLDALGKMSGASALYDSCYAASEKLMSGPHLKKVLILLTDGQDNYSRHGFDDVRRLLSRSNIIVYAVAILDELVDWLAPFGRGVLKQLCSMTGGKVFEPKTVAEMAEAVDYISTELRNQYTIGVKPNRDGKLHKIKMELAKKDESGKEPGKGKGPRYTVRSRINYR